jgi:ubiquinone/menaquinone biosynthesis C-methylase UbiE
LQKKDDGWECIDPEPYIETPAETLVEAVRTFPEEGAPFQWLARSWDGLVDFITGKLYAEEVMFPMGSFKLVEEVYNTSNVYGFYSRLAGRVVKHLVQEHFETPLTMLEVGAGTGNGTANVLNESSDRFLKYYFTDISKSLVQMGKRRFKKSGYDFLEYKTFDACTGLSSQGFSEESVDLILAVNVLHATDDILLALENIRKLLKKDGILVLSELSPPEGSIYRYMEMTFGLLPSYSKYSDRELRPLSPVLRPDKWIEFTEKAGFKSALAIPKKTDGTMDRGGVVICIK